jgi:hypothetical protein
LRTFFPRLTHFAKKAPPLEAFGGRGIVAGAAALAIDSAFPGRSGAVGLGGLRRKALSSHLMFNAKSA